MKIFMSVLTLFFGLLYLPIQIYGSWLLYNHVHATELMWFVWWINTPMLIVIAIMQSVLTAFKNKGE